MPVPHPTASASSIPGSSSGSSVIITKKRALSDSSCAEGRVSIEFGEASMSTSTQMRQGAKRLRSEDGNDDSHTKRNSGRDRDGEKKRKRKKMKKRKSSITALNGETSGRTRSRSESKPLNVSGRSTIPDGNEAEGSRINTSAQSGNADTANANALVRNEDATAEVHANDSLGADHRYSPADGPGQVNGSENAEETKKEEMDGDSTRTQDGPSEKAKGKRKAITTSRSPSPLPPPIESSEATIARLQEELNTANARLSAHSQALNSIANSLTCQICLDPMHAPYLLGPCGHLACYGCLIRWFTAPRNETASTGNPNTTSPAEPTASQSQPQADQSLGGSQGAGHALRNRHPPHRLIPRRQKTCPHCRAVITSRPIEVYGIKSMVGVVAGSGLVPGFAVSPNANSETSGTGSSSSTDKGEGTSNGTRARDANADPWAGIFPRENRVYAGNELWRLLMPGMPRGWNVYQGGWFAPRARAPRARGSDTQQNDNAVPPDGDANENRDNMGMYDQEDNVYRCLECMHEIYRGVCTNPQCRRGYPGHDNNADSDAEYAEALSDRLMDYEHSDYSEYSVDDVYEDMMVPGGWDNDGDWNSSDEEVMHHAIAGGHYEYPPSISGDEGAGYAAYDQMLRAQGAVLAADLTESEADDQDNDDGDGEAFDESPHWDGDEEEEEDAGSLAGFIVDDDGEEGINQRGRRDQRGGRRSHGVIEVTDSDSEYSEDEDDQNNDEEEDEEAMPTIRSQARVAYSSHDEGESDDDSDDSDSHPLRSGGRRSSLHNHQRTSRSSNRGSGSDDHDMSSSKHSQHSDDDQPDGSSPRRSSSSRGPTLRHSKRHTVIESNSESED